MLVRTLALPKGSRAGLGGGDRAGLGGSDSDFQVGLYRTLEESFCLRPRR